MSTDLQTQYAAIRANYSAEQINAVSRLYGLVRRHLGTSGGNTAAKLLLGLYNGHRFPFDLTDLRLLDYENFEAAMTVIRMDAMRTFFEIHVLIDAIYSDGHSTGAEFEQWAAALRLKGKTTAANLDKRAPRDFK